MGKDKLTTKGAPSYPCPPGFNGKLRLPYLWFSGRPLNGHRYTDATGFRYGTKSMDPSGYANAYQLMPGYKRFLMVRLPITASPAVAVAAAVEPEWTTLGGVGATLYGVKLAEDYWNTRQFRKHVIEPVAIGASAVMRKGHAAGQGHRWVFVPKDFRDNEESVIRVNLPLDWLAEDGDKRRLLEVVATRLHLEDVTPSWHYEDGRAWVDLRVPPEPPGMVSFREAMADMEASADNAPIMGYGPRGKLVTFDLELESPHLLIAGGSGAGKSELIAAIVAQFMRKGYGVMVLDAKYESHMWLRRVPGVHYASEAAELHEALLWLDNELLRRARFVASGGDPTTLEPLVAVLEEMNGATNRLRAYWKNDLGGTGMSPALTALGNLSSMGRSLRIHIIMSGQSLTAKATGGTENRENFGARTLARATAAQWRILAPQIKPAPTKRGAPGRWHVVVGDSLREYQAPFMDLKGKKNPNAEAELIEWATSGRPLPDVSAMIMGMSAAATTRTATIPTSEVAAAPGVSLRLWADENGVSLQSLRDWRNRRPDFPTEVGQGANNTALYDPDHLKAYVRDRLREPVDAGE